MRRAEHEKEMDLDRPAGDSGHCVIRLPRGRDCDAPVELATATAVRLAHAHLLARARVVGTLPDLVRGVGRLWRRKRAYSSSHERTHGGALWGNACERGGKR